MVGTCLEGLTNQRGGHVGKCGQSTGVLPEPQGFRREVVVTAFEPFVRQRWMAASHDCSYASAACFRTFSNLNSGDRNKKLSAIFFFFPSFLFGPWSALREHFFFSAES